MTIDKYIENTYYIKETPFTEEDKLIMEEWNNCNLSVTSRTTFELPVVFVNSYDMNSRIVPIKENDTTNYYNIVDISSWNAFRMLLSSLIVDEPNVLKAAYMYIKESLFIAQGNPEKARLYSSDKIYLTGSEFSREYEYNKQKESLEGSLMIFFHLLHEYSHFRLKSIQSRENSVLDVFVEKLLTDLENNKNGGSILAKYRHYLIDHLKSLYNNPDEKEELLCDMQGILLMLELSNVFPVKIILESIIAFLYVQMAFSIIKTSTSSGANLPLFYLRLNIVIEVADFLNDEIGAGIIAALLNKNNRFNHLTTNDLYIDKMIELNRHEQLKERINTLLKIDYISEGNYKLFDIDGRVHTLLNDLVFTADDVDALLFPNYQEDEKLMNTVERLGYKVLKCKGK